MVAGDERVGPGVQRRANAALQAMIKSADCFIAGLAGDYGEACLEFLRYFDVHDHDPARTAGEVDAFVFTLEQLFIATRADVLFHIQSVLALWFLSAIPLHLVVLPRFRAHSSVVVIMAFPNAHTVHT